MCHETNGLRVELEAMKTNDDQNTLGIDRTGAMLLHYAAIIEFAEDAIISKTLGGIITSWNPAAERIFGYAADEIVGRSILVLFPPEKRNEEYEILGRIANGQRIEHQEAVRVRKDGRLIDVSLTISPIKDTSGKIVGASKIARDITDEKKVRMALREALTRFKATMDDMIEGCQIVGHNLKVLYSNDAAGRVLGRSPGVFFGMTIREVYSELPGTDLIDTVERCLRDRLPLRTRVGKMDDAGEYVWLNVNVEPVPDGALVLWIGEQ